MSQIKLLGVLSDVHNDICGLEKALEALKFCDKIIHLGDIVEESPEANEIVRLLIEHKVSGVLGYHDSTALSISRNFSAETRNYLENLPLEIRKKNFLFVHDNPLSKEKGRGLTNSGGYIKDEHSAKSVFEESLYRVHFVGHTHRAEQYELDGREVTKITDEFVSLDPSKRYILNPGSVCLQQFRGTAPSVGVFDFVNKRFMINKI